MTAEPNHSDQADDIHILTLTLRGAKDENAAKRLLAELLSAKDPEALKTVEVRAGAEAGTFDADFPICCFYRGQEAYYGYCKYGVPGPCGPEYSGCPA